MAEAPNSVWTGSAIEESSLETQLMYVKIIS